MTLSRFSSPHLKLVLLRGALLMGSTVFNFFAVRWLPLTLTSTILFSGTDIYLSIILALTGRTGRYISLVSHYAGLCRGGYSRPSV